MISINNSKGEKAQSQINGKCQKIHSEKSAKSQVRIALSASTFSHESECGIFDTFH